MMRLVAMTVSILSTYWSFLLLDMRTESDFYTICCGCQNLQAIFSDFKHHVTMYFTGLVLATTMVRNYLLQARSEMKLTTSQVLGYYTINYYGNTLTVHYEGASIAMVSI